MSETISSDLATLYPPSFAPITSDATTIEHHPSSYISSAQLENQAGRPSAIWLIFPSMSEDRFYGRPAGQTIEIDPDLLEEFRAWDMLSDEAFINFEQNLD